MSLPNVFIGSLVLRLYVVLDSRLKHKGMTQSFFIFWTVPFLTSLKVRSDDRMLHSYNKEVKTSMPTYGYQCKSCSYEFEEFQKISDESLTVCPSCKKETLIRIIGGGAGLHFKGSGFYQTDYKKPGSGEKKTTPTKKETKPDPKPDTKPDTKPSETSSTKNSGDSTS